MNETVHKYLLPGDKFMTEMHFKRLHGFTYSACGDFTKKYIYIYIYSKKQDIQDIFIKANR